MAERQGETYYDNEGAKTTSVGAQKSAGDVASAAARAKYDPAMRRPDASSLDAPTGTSPLAIAAQREAARKKKLLEESGSTGRAKAVKSMLTAKDTDDQQ